MTMHHAVTPSAAMRRMEQPRATGIALTGLDLQ
jgi:hypothetical protein